ncbi:bifunctional serine/threonine-protein kinase/formylglycine-generating enzyme family protein [Pseudanabaena sp. PCC 6802]|uniref:bifunctional serine/threonine-protein kinase/formylglycine-generating enzyme family protein n=1 Tax=Pseudanabaena sp. PCC 6802 TaxID=118173 RepID=UPI00034C1994|nr:bifunctional serine/threonine-protein kinase/formylglycine-generating enzyme family protein [Pseudanabaena sp. PCC 6802]
MSYCLNPSCYKRQNSAKSRFCQNCGAKLSIGDRYRAERLIAQGGFGRTFLGIDAYKPSQPKCAIKQFAPQGQGNLDKAAELFKQEAMRLEELGKHDRIPELLAYCEQEGQQYLIQEFVDGRDLGSEIAQQGTFDQAKVRHFLCNLLPVLQFIHAGGVIHRDIKPENIIRRNSDRQLVLVDFGAAKYATSTALLKTGTSIGSAEFMAPEQARGKAVFASDLYSLGVTCIYLLTGISPFDLIDGNNDWIWRSHLKGNPVNGNLAKTLDRLIAHAVNYRYQSVEQVLADLDPAIAINRSRPIGQKSLAQTTARNVTSPAVSNNIMQNGNRTAKHLAEIEALRHSLSSPTHHPNRPPMPAAMGRSAVQIVANRIAKPIQPAIAASSPFPQVKKPNILENLGGGIVLEMIYIPAGTFLMGASPQEGRHSGFESIQHPVSILPFYMGKYPITQAQWMAVAMLPPVNRTLDLDPSYFKGSNRPVECVSWYDAVEFCDRLYCQTGRNYQLPSEAQWEYACRAGTDTPFYFGKHLSSNLANYDDVYSDGYRKNYYRPQTSEVGIFPANAFGLHDMHGNVWEWCADNWHESYQGAPDDGSAWEESGNDRYRLSRGCSWRNHQYNCRSSFRNRLQPDRKDNNYGFRVAIS